MTNAIIFDYGKVIGNDPSEHIYNAISKEFKVELQKIKSEFLNFIIPLEIGEISDDFFWKKIAQNLNIGDHAKLRKIWLKEFSDHMRMDSKMITTIENLSKKYKLCLLSNNAVFYQTKRISCQLEKLFPIQIFSFKVGMRKPEKEIYDLVLEKLKIQPNECLIIDDNEKCLIYPRELGMKTIHFQDFESFIKELKEKIKINKK
mgnify:CR=1 FL=1